MLLAVDAGNTNTVFALFDKDRNKHVWRIATDVRRTADEYAVWLTQLMSLVGASHTAVTGVVIASVVPEGVQMLVTLSQRYFQIEPLVIGEGGVDPGIEVLVDHPSEVGADRLVNAIAAYARYGGSLIIVDLGTATTFDYLDQHGNYAGGVIAPGCNLSLQALYMAAAKLPQVVLRRPQKVIATSGTVAAMQSGVFWGYVGLIEGIVARMRAETNVALKVIATGGLAPLFAGASDVFSHVDSDLTLDGLMMIWDRHRAGAAG